MLVDANGKLILGASALAIGKLAANDGVDIGDVDVASIAAGDNNIGNVDVVTLPSLPTGANTIGSVKITDGTDTALITAEDILRIISLPTRLTSDLGASAVFLGHGTVTADWTIDDSTAKTQSATYNLYITDISVSSGTDLTTEIAIQEIPFKLIIQDGTDGQIRWFGMGSIPSNTHFNLLTPIKIQKGHEFYSRIYLGGATNANISVLINGFESAD